MSNKAVLMINNKEDEKVGIILPIDEDTIEIKWDDDFSETLSLEEFDTLMENPNFELTEEANEANEDDEDEDEKVDENIAQVSIKAHKTADVRDGDETDHNPKTRFDYIRNIIGRLADLDMTSLTKYYNDQQALVGGEAARAKSDKDEYNRSTIKMHPSAAMENVDIKLDKEHQDVIFAESSLSDEAKEKVSTLFEAAVSAKVVNEVIKLQEMYENKLIEHIEEITNDLTDSIDIYLNKVASEWLEENEVAIESSLRLEMFNDFMEGLHNLMTEHYIDLPEDKVDILERVVNENETLVDELNENINKMLELEKIIDNMNKDNIILNTSEGLSLIQKEKLKKLTENVTFTTEEEFKKSVKVIKEGFLNEKNSNSNILNEGFEENNKKENVIKDSRIDRIANVLTNL